MQFYIENMTDGNYRRHRRIEGREIGENLRFKQRNIKNSTHCSQKRKNRLESKIPDETEKTKNMIGEVRLRSADDIDESDGEKALRKGVFLLPGEAS